jgi:hypothetical protein
MAVQGTVTVGGVQFSYSEHQPGGSGAGPRGIFVNGGGSEKKLFHPITPNPHTELGSIYVDNATEFYAAAAKHITQGFSKPELKTFTKLKDNERPPTIKGDAWTKLTKDKQKQEVANYNTKGQEKAEAENKKALKDEVESHFKGKKGTEFTWKNKKFKLP